MNCETISVTKEGRKATGSRCGNQDRIVNRVFEQVPGISGPVYLIAVADGVSHGSYGGSVARYVAERHLQTDSASPVQRQETLVVNAHGKFFGDPSRGTEYSEQIDFKKN